MESSSYYPFSVTNQHPSTLTTPHMKPFTHTLPPHPPPLILSLHLHLAIALSNPNPASSEPVESLLNMHTLATRGYHLSRFLARRRERTTLLLDHLTLLTDQFHSPTTSYILYLSMPFPKYQPKFGFCTFFYTVWCSVICSVFFLYWFPNL